MQPFGFAGGLWDPEAQLVQMGARWYDPVVGRFITKDPIGFGGGYNLYAYAGNDPVNFYDPSGEDVKSFAKCMLQIWSWEVCFWQEMMGVRLHGNDILHA